jgi:hypothetical protein
MMTSDPPKSTEMVVIGVMLGSPQSKLAILNFISLSQVTMVATHRLLPCLR